VQNENVKEISTGHLNKRNYICITHFFFDAIFNSKRGIAFLIKFHIFKTLPLKFFRSGHQKPKFKLEDFISITFSW
jgi:hypothetical protein